MSIEDKLEELGYEKFEYSPTGGPFHGPTYTLNGIIVELLESVTDNPEETAVHVIFGDTEVIVPTERLLRNDMKINIQINL